jgi:hypothetical protein
MLEMQGGWSIVGVENQSMKNEGGQGGIAPQVFLECLFKFLQQNIQPSGDTSEQPLGDPRGIPRSNLLVTLGVTL